MRIIALGTLKRYWQKNVSAEQPLKAWFEVVEEANWLSPNEVKLSYANASILSEKRVVFNIGGNKYRLVADIKYAFSTIYIVWIGTHAEYDKIDARTVDFSPPN
jgi:mRNA interferase HigB